MFADKSTLTGRHFGPARVDSNIPGPFTLSVIS
jgi:hypothetical protein